MCGGPDARRRHPLYPSYPSPLPALHRRLLPAAIQPYVYPTLGLVGLGGLGWLTLKIQALGLQLPSPPDLSRMGQMGAQPEQIGLPDPSAILAPLGGVLLLGLALVVLTGGADPPKPKGGGFEGGVNPPKVDFASKVADAAAKLEKVAADEAQAVAAAGEESSAFAKVVAAAAKLEELKQAEGEGEEVEEGETGGGLRKRLSRLTKRSKEEE